MTELTLPHLDPIRFAKYIISQKDDTATVRSEFQTIPSLGMMIEASAQSSAVFANEDEKGKVGYLTLLKNVKLLATPTSLIYDISLILTHKSEGVGYISFEVMQQDTQTIATGILMVTTV